MVKTSGDITVYNELNIAEMHTSALLETLFYKTENEIKNTVAYKDIQNCAREYIDAVLRDKESAIRTVLYNGSMGHYTIAHSMNVCTLSVITARDTGYTEREIIKVAIAALLHDIGKRFISRELLYKEKPLSYNEMKWMCMHTSLGAAYIKRLYPKISTDIIDGILFHHERLNGKGYPNGLYGDIPYIARLIAVCDVFEAYTAKRPYHESRSISEGLTFLSKQEGLNEALVDVVLSEFSVYEGIA